MNFAAFGFFVVPAFDGVIFDSPVTTGAGFWASATVGMASDREHGDADQKLAQVGSPPQGQVTTRDPGSRLDH